MARAHARLAVGDVTWLVVGGRSAANLRLYRRAGYVDAGHLVDGAGVGLVRMERRAGALG